MSEARRRTLRWESWDRTGLEHCSIRADGEHFIAEGLVVAPREEGFAARYEIRFDADWSAYRVTAAVDGGRSVAAEADQQGLWSSNGRPLPQMRYAIAPDLQCTPLTNTFAIRRLNLRPGESADIETVYFAFPELALTADPQRYTCLEHGRSYLFQSLDSDFKAEIEVDADGFVTHYPGLFRRVA